MNVKEDNDERSKAYNMLYLKQNRASMVTCNNHQGHLCNLQSGTLDLNEITHILNRIEIALIPLLWE